MSSIRTSDNRGDARPKSKADDIYNNPPLLDGADLSVYGNLRTWFWYAGLFHTLKVKLKEMTALDSLPVQGIPLTT